MKFWKVWLYILSRLLFLFQVGYTKQARDNTDQNGGWYPILGA